MQGLSQLAAAPCFAIKINHLAIQPSRSWTVNFIPHPFVNSILNVIFRSIMKTIDIKQELRNLIEKEDDLHLLEAIKTLLVKSRLDPLLKNKLASRALKAEED